MGYHVTILRTNGKQTMPITKAEVIALAEAFPGWQYDADQDALVSLDSGDDAPALWLTDGELWTTNPRGETMASMLALARHLNARVRGDELETYRTPAESYLHADDAAAKADADAENAALIRRSRVRSWAFRGLAVASAALLSFVLQKFGLLK